MKKFTLVAIALFALVQTIHAQDDKYKSQEDIYTKKSMVFVNIQNKNLFEKLRIEKDNHFIKNMSFETYNLFEKIDSSTIQENYSYLFWKDKAHEKGIWRRFILFEYINGKLSGESLIYIDALSIKDNIKLVYNGNYGLCII